MNTKIYTSVLDKLNAETINGQSYLLDRIDQWIDLSKLDKEQTCLLIGEITEALSEHGYSNYIYHGAAGTLVTIQIQGASTYQGLTSLDAWLNAADALLPIKDNQTPKIRKGGKS